MKKYWMSVLGIIITIVICISVGCLGGKKDADIPVTISIWHVYGAQTDSPLNDLIDIFNDTVGAEKGIQVEVTMVSNNNTIHEHILAAANEEPGASKLPDIFVAYPKTIQAMPSKEILVDYYSYFAKDELDKFVPEFLEDGKIGDKLLILPVAKSTEVLFVNKTVFERFSADTGVTMNSLKTWEGLYEAAEKYVSWSDDLTPDVSGDGKAMFVHDFHFNYFQVGVESLGESFFANEKINFSDTFSLVWDPYARAALSGGVWLHDGYATEPLRTGDAIVSVASSASVLYFSDEVIYPDNTSETITWEILPCPVFENGSKMVMQRGAGMCVVKSTPEQEQAAITFLKWLTEAQRNTEFAVSTGYMPVKQEAFKKYLPDAIEHLENQKFVSLYEAFAQTQDTYEFYTPLQFEGYLELETEFEKNIRLRLSSGRRDYLEKETADDVLLKKSILENYHLFKQIIEE